MAGQWTLYRTSNEVDPVFKPFADSLAPPEPHFLLTSHQ
jgi:hypothetical protein